MLLFSQAVLVFSCIHRPKVALLHSPIIVPSLSLLFAYRLTANAPPLATLHSLDPLCCPQGETEGE